MRTPLYTLVLLFICSPLAAQIYVETSGTTADEQLSSMYLQHGKPDILYDRTAQWAALSTFDAEKEAITPNYFKQALSELHSAAATKKFIDAGDIDPVLDFDPTYSSSVLGFLNTRFQSLKDEERNFKNRGGQLHYSASGSPYNSHDLTMISPLSEVLTGPEIRLKLNRKLVFDEHPTRRLESVVLHTENGQTHTLLDRGHFTTNQVRLYFPQAGEKTLQFRVRFSDGTVAHTQAKIFVKDQSRCERELDNRVSKNDTITSTILFKGYDEPTAIYGQVYFRVYYQTQNKSAPLKLKKPIIIIDGFDPLDGRKIEDCDPHDFKSDEEHKSIRDMMQYTKYGEPVDLINELRDKGYDVVIVNQPMYTRVINGKETLIDGGADYIERNGLNHVSLYNEINRQLKENGSTEKLVIVGPSMGGQISRYALAYMEKNNIDHNTRLWISVDSPHLGANIPRGTQSLLYDIAASDKSKKAKDFVKHWLGSAAAKQQLIDQFVDIWKYSNIIDGRTKTQGYKTDKGHPYFINFYNNLFSNGVEGSKGYPQNTRNIALVNGSLSGNKSFKNPFSRDWYTKSGTTFTDYFGNPEDRSLYIVGIKNIFGAKLVGTRIESFFPSDDKNKFSRISSFYYKKILGYNKSQWYWKNENTRAVLDLVPGGWFPVHQIFAKSTFEDPEKEVSWYEMRHIKHASSFIPTVSALGHFNPDFDWNTPMNTKNLLCLQQIPFDSYYGESYNTEHTSFTQESVEWLFKEIDGVETYPHYPYTYKINGPKLICSTNTTFKIADNECDVPATVKQWSVSSGLTINSQNKLSVNVSSSSIRTNNYETITGELENGKYIHKEIAVQKPYIFDSWRYSREEPESVPSVRGDCDGYGAEIEREIKGIGFDASSSFEWEKLNGTFHMYTYRNTITIIPASTQNPTLSYKVRVRGSCGSWSDWRTFYETNPCYEPSPVPDPDPNPAPSPEKPLPRISTNDGVLLFEIYPNPSSNYINVTLKSGTTNTSISYTLYDITSTPVKTGQLQDDNSIFVGDLKSGIYIISLTLEDYEEKQQLIIDTNGAE